MLPPLCVQAALLELTAEANPHTFLLPGRAPARRTLLSSSSPSLLTASLTADMSDKGWNAWACRDTSTAMYRHPQPAGIPEGLPD